MKDRAHLRLVLPSEPEVAAVPDPGAWHPWRGGRPPAVPGARDASPGERVRLVWGGAGAAVIELAAWR